MTEIRSLTSLRGLAALWVFLFHLAAEQPDTFGGAGRILAIGRGYIAVDLFFVLSGFVMALTYRGLFRDTPFSAAYPRFLWRRIARIMPLNAVIVLAIAAAVWFVPGSLPGNFGEAKHPWTVLANLFLVQDWGLAPSIDKPAWSVSVEMALYLIYPLLLALAWSRRLWAAPALIGCAALAWLAGQGQGVVSQGLVSGDFIRGLAGFYFGLLCFRLFAAPAARKVAGQAELAIVAAFWALFVWSPSDLWPILLCPALVFSLATEQGLVGRVLKAGPLHYLGQISYSIYLTHDCVIAAVGGLPIGSGALRAGLAAALTLLLSAATYHGIERPARRWIAGKNKTMRKLSGTPSPAIVGPVS